MKKKTDTTQSKPVEQKRRTPQHPCVYKDWSERHQTFVDCYPAVSCSFDCDHCGWNPVVAGKRIIKMQEELIERSKKNGNNHNLV